MVLFFVSLSVLFQFLRSGGEELLDELSLSRQGRVGEIIITKGHNFNIRSKSSFFKKGVALTVNRTKIHDLAGEWLQKALHWVYRD